MLRLAVCVYGLRFAFEARTSRGLLSARKIWFLRLCEDTQPQVFGLGECAPLWGLSTESEACVVRDLRVAARSLADFPTAEAALAAEHTWRRGLCASVGFACEMALLDLRHGGHRCLFAENSFFAAKPIAINGLIWMGDVAFMWQQVEEKLSEGFRCLKLKIGGLPFEQECDLLARIRARADARHMVLRLDANGAFAPEEAALRLRMLARYGIHSIEQPVGVAHKAACARLCTEGAIPIALDESLIGVSPTEEGDALLDEIAPQYLVLKPTLLGGFGICRQWIAKAEARGIGWWLTSALESNVGLNAIAQWSASLPGTRIEGLGTGQLYLNNIESPLQLGEGTLSYNAHRHWALSQLSFEDVRG